VISKSAAIAGADNVAAMRLANTIFFMITPIIYCHIEKRSVPIKNPIIVTQISQKNHIGCCGQGL
jgi:hypothetical protein